MTLRELNKLLIENKKTIAILKAGLHSVDSKTEYDSIQTTIKICEQDISKLQKQISTIK